MMISKAEYDLVKEEFNALFPGLRPKSQILTDSWVVRLGQQHKEEAMENNYRKELHELNGIYGATIEKIEAAHSEKLEALIHFMADFIDCHQARKKYKKKLAILQAKIKSEEGSDEDEDDGDEDEHCC